MGKDRANLHHNGLHMMLLHSLHRAVETGRTSVASRLLSDAGEATRYAVVNQYNEEGNTPLHIAVITDHQEVAIKLKLIEILIQAGANINAFNRAGHTALHIAIGKRHHNINYNILVEALITFGANVDAAFHGYGGMPLKAATTLKNKSVIGMFKHDDVEQDITGRVSLRNLSKNRCAIL